MTLLEELVDHLDIAAAVLSQEDGRWKTNRLLAEILSRPVETTRELVELLSPDDGVRARLSEALRAAADGEASDLSLPSGDERAVAELRVQAERLGGPSSPLLVLVTSPRHAQIAQARLDRLERLAAVGQLSASVTHEINNVLTAILGWTQISLRDVSRVERVESALEIIDESSRRAKAIIDDVMGIARGEPRGDGPVRLADVANEALRVLSWELSNREIAVERAYRDAGVVDVDRRKLFQIFLNIVLNAIQAMPDSGTLAVEIVRAGDRVTITFRDNGVGMTPETLAQVFEPHFTTKGRDHAGGGGSGMGLAICKKLAAEIGGELSASGKLGDGAAFTLALTVVEERAPKLDRLRQLEAEAQLHQSVLVVEGEGPIRALILESLEGCEVTATGSAIEAVALCRRQRYDVALVDFTLPGASGTGLAKTLGEISPELRIILLSGRPELPDAEALGVEAVLRKPFEIEHLLAVLRPPRKDRDDEVDEAPGAGPRD